MAYPFVQAQSSTLPASGASVTITFAAANTAGNIIVVPVTWGAVTGKVTSVTDTQGNVYQQATGANPHSHPVTSNSIWYAFNIKGGSGNVITVTFDASHPFPSAAGLEYTGVVNAYDPLDVAANAQGTAGNTTVTASAKFSGDLFVCTADSDNNITAPGAGFTQRILDADGVIYEDAIMTNAGNITATSTSAGGNWGTVAAAFRMQSGQPASPAAGALLGGIVG